MASETGPQPVAGDLPYALERARRCDDDDDDVCVCVCGSSVCGTHVHHVVTLIYSLPFSVALCDVWCMTCAT